MARQIADRADLLPALTELFRSEGYEGVSLSSIEAASGLARGSLYHLFPGGKAEMAAAVLADVEAWFQQHVLVPLAREPAARGIALMADAMETCFVGGEKGCVFAVFALAGKSARFAAELKRFFGNWQDALAEALIRAGQPPASAHAAAEARIADLYGALVLSRAMDDPEPFGRALARLRTFDAAALVPG
ncbi:TetR family transcriptional regulator [Humitalea rosea]|uniref:TetR family transcriptional regulator n=1 Tax=Humitalea rosea TaxID=990373 RepID=A0A2W7J4E2_9PROT|nr:TetR/AcrR family transcriptional regulator [Humitalea rosea]PZW45943.1 TetR family transcriptional regulator [Humitalea rosea]